MTHIRLYFCWMISIVSFAWLTGCSTSKPDQSQSKLLSASISRADTIAFASPTDLTATLTSLTNVDLHWKNNATSPACYFVEFAFTRHSEDDDFTMLGALWPDTTTFRHDGVAPETLFAYRIRPLFGQPSAVVEVSTTAASLSKNRIIARVKDDFSETISPNVEGPLENLSSDPQRKILSPKKSVRTTLTADEAAPDNLTVTLSFPTTVDLRWQDRAADEDGYLVDVSLSPTNDFRLCALLPPDTTSFRKAGLPLETKCYFRVRAFFYGKPSNVVEITTGPAPDKMSPDMKPPS